MSPNEPPGPLSILCAEDNQLLGELMVKVFTRAGHRAEHVADGLAAWRRLADALSSFHVVVTDHQMPGLLGTELVAQLRRSHYAGRVVVHSSSLTDEVRAEYRDLGVACFVAKSCRPETLLRAVEGGDHTGTTATGHRFAPHSRVEDGDE